MTCMKAFSVYSQLNHLQLRAAPFHSSAVLLHHYKRSGPRKSFGKKQKKQSFDFYNRAYAEGVSKLLGKTTYNFNGARFGKQRPSMGFDGKMPGVGSWEAVIGPDAWSSYNAVGKGQPPWYYIFNSKSTQKSKYTSPQQNPKIYWNWRELTDTEETTGSDDSEQESTPQVDLSSHRRTLGLSATGPLTMVVLKEAYRGCALKWHPDRHQGASKAVAEKNFKSCSAAYQSLCAIVEH